jgi:hypothetical protein
MKKIYITLLAIAAIGASQMVLADDRGIKPKTADVNPPPPSCKDSQEYSEYSKCFNRLEIEREDKCTKILKKDPCS